MFWRHEIKIPSGYEAVVNGRLEARTPLRVGTNDQVYFVSFAPSIDGVLVETPCKEGIEHKITVTVKIEFQRENLAEILRDAGHANFRSIPKVSVQDFMARQKLLDSIKASIQTYAHETGFFDLAEQEQTRKALHQRIHGECTKVRLIGEVVSCEVRPSLPDKTLLAQLAASAGAKEVIEGETRTRKYSDVNLGKGVEYFLETERQAEQIQLETSRQAELMKAEIERTKVDAERAKEEPLKQIEESRANVKIAQLQQQDRVKELEAALQKKDAERQRATQELHAGTKESGAAYEFKYKSNRLEEDMKLARMRVEVAKVQEAEEEARLERKRKEQELELERERSLAKIRAEEKANMLVPLGGLLEKLGEIPAADYKGVHTLISGAGLGGADSKEFATGLVLGLLSRAAEGVGVPSGPSQGDEKKK